MRIICPYCRLGTEGKFIKGPDIGALAVMRCHKCRGWLMEPTCGCIATPLPQTAKMVGQSWVDYNHHISEPFNSEQGVHIPGIDPEVVKLESPRVGELDFAEYLNEFAKTDGPPLHHGRYIERSPTDEKTVEYARQLESMRY